MTKLTGDFGDFLEELKNGREPKPITNPADPLAASCAAYEQWRAGGFERWAALESVTITHENRDQANAIRQYYRDRYTLNVLKGKVLTPYQQTVYKIVTTDTVLDNEIGLIYKLPYLYNEDCQYDEMFTGKHKPYKQDHKYPGYPRDLTLTPYNKPVYLCRRTGDVMQYWFTDANENFYVIPIQSSNTLRTIVESIHRKNSPINISANVHRRPFRGIHDITMHILTHVEIV